MGGKDEDERIIKRRNKDGKELAEDRVYYYDTGDDT